MIIRKSLFFFFAREKNYSYWNTYFWVTMTKTAGHRNNSRKEKDFFRSSFRSNISSPPQGREVEQLCLWRQGPATVDVPVAAARKAGLTRARAGLQTSEACLPLVVTYFLQPGSASERFQSPKMVPAAGDQVLRLETRREHSRSKTELVQLNVSEMQFTQQ